MDGNEATRMEQRGMELRMPGPDREHEIEIDGQLVRVPVLTLERTLHYFDLLERAMGAESLAQRQILREFPKEAGLLDYHITPAEVFDILRVFCFRRGWNPAIPAEPKKGTTSETTTTPTMANSDSMT